MGHANIDWADDEDKIKFQVPGDDLRAHCKARADHHKARQEFFKKKSEEFAEEIDNQRNQVNQGAISSGLIFTGTIENNRGNMLSQMRSHEDKKFYFRFCEKYLRKELYELSEDQARRFELIS